MFHPFATRLLLVGLLVIMASVGCGRNGSTAGPQVAPPPQRPLRAMESEVRRGHWQKAAEYVDDVLQAHPDDPEVLSSVARVVFENGDRGRAAELLVQACRAESFANANRVQQAIVAMIGEGQFFDGLSFLEQAIDAHPDQSSTRRWLYDFYMGSEHRYAGLPHGRVLVRQRVFDIELLTTLSNTERRTQDAQPLTEMTARNPNDKRPLLGDAKTKFDAGDYDDCLKQIREIVAAHPDYLPAQALLGRTLATVRDFEGLAAWIESQSEAMSQIYPEYWVAIGDWLREEGHASESARAYWEATQRDVDWMEPWSKLGAALEAAKESSSNEPSISLTEAERTGIRERTERLSRFNQLKSRFERTGMVSRATVIEMAQVLRELGRLWEAEAWASVALSLPEDESVDVTGARDSIVALLNSETPWQLRDGFPELLIDLQGIPLTHLSIDHTAPSPPASDGSNSGQALSTDVIYELTNEAGERGLSFFGRTGDRLDEPGIMLFQTLGCGGGTIDFDRDGWSDLYLAAAGGTPPDKDSASNSLMRNLGGRFADVTTASHSQEFGFTQGIAVGDVNEDGFADLLVLNYGPNTLFVNNGDGTFRDDSALLPNNGNQWSTCGAIADIDGDGINDVTIVNYCAGLEPITVGCPSAETGVTQSCSPMKFDAERDQFLQGDGRGGFVDRSESWQAIPTIPGRGLGIVAGSLDDSPGVDLFIANDMTNNHYWSGRKEADHFQLRESAMLRGLGTDDRALAQGSMGIATGDLDADGDVDFYVTNFDKEYNTLHVQRSGGLWQDETNRWGLATPTLPMVGFGAVAVDLDLDATLELVVTNGHVDIFSRDQTRSIYAQPLQVFRRNASMVFEQIPLQGEYGSTPHVGRALWTIDADRDARVDLAVTHQSEPGALLINRGPARGNWLELTLVGTQDSRDAIGAVAHVRIGDQTWMAPQLSGDGYQCSGERVLRFALGDAASDQSVTVTVTWPNGETDLIEGIHAEAAWMVVQGHPSEAHRLR
jgi:tetratricopeptide (TPR) repeat protein